MDNALVVHYPDTAVVMLLDVALDMRQAVANPLPLKRITFLPAGIAADDRAADNTVSGSAGDTGGCTSDNSAGTAVPQSSASTLGSRVTQVTPALHKPTWAYFMPNVILDVSTKALSKLHLDLRVVVESANDLPALVGFLQRRRSPPLQELAVEPRDLLLGVCRSALQVGGVCVVSNKCGL